MNVTIKAGRITADLELKRVGNNDTPVISFSIAENYKIKGEKKTNFFRVKALGKTAELIAQYFSKGDLFSFKGYTREERFVDKEGNKRSIIVDYVENIDFDTSITLGEKVGKSLPPKPESSQRFAPQPDDDLPF